jgi:hypothetical protein
LAWFELVPDLDFDELVTAKDAAKKRKGTKASQESASSAATSSQKRKKKEDEEPVYKWFVRSMFAVILFFQTTSFMSFFHFVLGMQVARA